ncbi:MAG: hypothetical protein E6K46_10315 [Gammaproteobacteria bacterium]|nr:MAG: hypothetical protein E6K46_10315 [Gammaproteobacteria bacterium]
MRRSTDRLIALQFLAVAVPIAFVLLAQMAADARRAAALEQSRPLRTLANEARANYRTFTNGAADAVDTGALGRQSAEALNTTAALLARLAERGEAAALGDTPGQVADLAAQVASGATLERLMALRREIARADHETRAIDESFEAAAAAGGGRRHRAAAPRRARDRRDPLPCGDARGARGCLRDGRERRHGMVERHHE